MDVAGIISSQEKILRVVTKVGELGSQEVRNSGSIYHANLIQANTNQSLGILYGVIVSVYLTTESLILCCEGVCVIGRALRWERGWR